MDANLQDKIRGCLLGGAIGDALGYPIEFKTNIKDKQFTKFENDRGIISDDTQMTLFIANALLWRETRWHIRGIAMTPPEAIYLGLLDWLSTQQRVEESPKITWIRNLPELNILRAPGNTCITALESGKMGTLGDPINDSKGCGGIMRLAPIGLYINTEDNIGNFSAMSCAITHGHPLAILSAYTLGLIITYVTLQNQEIEVAIKKAKDKMISWKPDAWKDGKKVHINWRAEKNKLNSIIDQALALAKQDQKDTETIKSLGSGWVAEEALAIAIYSCAKHQDSFKDAVICAVNHNGDSDSTGAIAGNIIGGKLGLNNIPDYYKNQIELKDIIMELADDIYHGVPTNVYGDVTDKTWLKKYVIIK
ncbi:ADP-ribosylglycohydrolase family protein [Candidatus Saccharibacteria bacterium]|nr:ADP-ribosylglycohydrolase family protein [Candidatus Saccharibacteria bacterium]